MDFGGVLWKGNIPIDLENDILLRLPAKSLGRCMCTCKRWYSLIKSAEFITSHLNHSKVKDHGVLIVQEGCYSIFSESESNLVEKERGQIPFPVMERKLHILGSCRGLILVEFKVERGWLVLLWNPSLNKSKVIDSVKSYRARRNPHVCSRWCLYALGFNETRNDYRVVRIYRTSKYYSYAEVVDVYSLTNHSWHRVAGTLPNGTSLPRIADYKTMANYVNRAVHWLAMYNLEENERFVILSFDFDNEVFNVIELPDRYSCYDQKSYSLKLKQLNGKLALFGIYPDPCEFLYYTWVMKDYPLVESWTNFGCLFKHEGKNDKWPIACTQKENCIFEQSVSETCNMFMYYNAKEDKIYEFETVAAYKCPIIVDFVDCLVLLDHVDNDVLEDQTPEIASVFSELEILSFWNLTDTNEHGQS